MSKLAEGFNRSGLSRFLVSPAGRVYRVVAGLGFIILGYFFRSSWLGIVSIVWGALAFIAGAFDLCFISAVLGGPVSGAKIRGKSKTL